MFVYPSCLCMLICIFVNEACSPVLYLACLMKNTYAEAVLMFGIAFRFRINSDIFPLRFGSKMKKDEQSKDDVHISFLKKDTVDHILLMGN